MQRVMHGNDAQGTASSTADPPGLVLGVSSLLGWSLLRHSSGLAPFCNRHTRIPEGQHWQRLNLQDRAAVAALFRRQRPRLILHCAGICDVDKCAQSPEFAHEVNVVGMANLLDHIPSETRLIYMSSEHVFSGDSGPYVESSAVDPISVYGETRVRAEQMMLDRHPRGLVIRAGLWIGDSYNGRIGHLDWLRYRTRRGLPMTVIADEYRSAVWARDAVARVLALANSDVTGIRHIYAAQTTSRPALARYLDGRFAIGAHFAVRHRRQLPRPHIGDMDLRTEFEGTLATPLTPVVPPT